MRGYLLAGKEEFLEPYKGGKVKFASLIGNLRQTVSDNPPQVQLLTETEQNIRHVVWIDDVDDFLLDKFPELKRLRGPDYQKKNVIC